MYGATEYTTVSEGESIRHELPPPKNVMGACNGALVRRHPTSCATTAVRAR